MKRMMILLVVLLLDIHLYSQDSLPFITNLGEKQKATFGDAVTLFMYATNKAPRGFAKDSTMLKESGILTGMDYEEQRPLRRGMIARMVARYMHLTGSLLYNIFGTERYAYVACIQARIMDPDASEWDILSGEELIEVISRMTGTTEEAE